MRTRQFPRLPARCIVLGLSCAVLMAGCGGKEGGGTQVAAKVNGKELTVHQVNFVLQQNPQLAAVGASAPQQVLDRLVDQELSLQQALDQKLDRDPNVVSAIEAAKREITARAYMDRVVAQVGAPTDQEVQAYFDAKPELFAQRQIYDLADVQLVVPPGDLAELQGLLAAQAGTQGIMQWAERKQLRAGLSHATRAAETLPLALLPQLAVQPIGQGLLQVDGSMAHVFYVESRRAEPVTLEQTRTAIQAAIVNEHKRLAAETELKRLRAAAKIEYVGAFANAAAPNSAAPTATAPSAAASGGLDAETLKKGLGLR